MICAWGGTRLHLPRLPFVPPTPPTRRSRVKFLWPGTILYLPASQFCFCLRLRAKQGADLCLAGALGIEPRPKVLETFMIPFHHAPIIKKAHSRTSKLYQIFQLFSNFYRKKKGSGNSRQANTQIPHVLAFPCGKPYFAMPSVFSKAAIRFLIPFSRASLRTLFWGRERYLVTGPVKGNPPLVA